MYSAAFWWADLPEIIEEKLFGIHADLRKRWVAYGLSLSVYRLPLYTTFALFSGYYWGNVLEICLYYAAENLVLGGPYLYFRKKCERKVSEQTQS